MKTTNKKVGKLALPVVDKHSHISEPQACLSQTLLIRPTREGLLCLIIPTAKRPVNSLFPYTTLFRSTKLDPRNDGNQSANISLPASSLRQGCLPNIPPARTLLCRHSVKKLTI